MENNNPDSAGAAMVPGAAREALRVAIAALDASEHDASPARRCEALGGVGRNYHAVGELDAAEWYLMQALRGTRPLESPQAVAELLCELAEVAVQIAERDACDEDPGHVHAALERARDHGFEATRLAARSGDAAWETAVLARIAEVLDRCGDRDDAIALQCRALRLICFPSRDTAPGSLM